MRLIDILVSLVVLLLALPIILTILIILRFNTRNPLFKQRRIGKGFHPFHIYKLRTIRENADSNISTHLMDASMITPIGKLLRASKLDELPQLLNVLRGEMSLVGPRPNLYSQNEVIKQRLKQNVYSVRPGITGLAQIRRVDMSSPRNLVRFDRIMILNSSVCFNIKILIMTVNLMFKR